MSKTVIGAYLREACEFLHQSKIKRIEPTLVIQALRAMEIFGYAEWKKATDLSKENDFPKPLIGKQRKSYFTKFQKIIFLKTYRQLLRKKTIPESIEKAKLKFWKNATTQFSLLEKKFLEILARTNSHHYLSDYPAFLEQLGYVLNRPLQKVEEKIFFNLCAEMQKAKNGKLITKPFNYYEWKQRPDDEPPELSINFKNSDIPWAQSLLTEEELKRIQLRNTVAIKKHQPKIKKLIK